MKCQLISTLEAGRRTRSAHAYPVIWGRAASRYLRWYLSLAVRALGKVPVVGWTKAQLVVPRSADERRLKAGDWVRIKSRTEIEAMQQGADASDVVVFIPAPMSRYCGRTLRVLSVLEHYYDEVREGLCRAENAILLEGSTCDSSQLGRRRCDRRCLHFWKESWLERVAGPERGTDREVLREAAVRSRGKRQIPLATNQGLQAGTLVRVRDLQSIEKTLDEHGTLEGVPFIREHMAAHCGRFFLVDKKVSHFFDEKSDYMISLLRAYLLAGVRCDGRQSGGEAHCDRRCALTWHEAWLERASLEPVRETAGRREVA